MVVHLREPFFAPTRTRQGATGKRAVEYGPCVGDGVNFQGYPWVITYAEDDAEVVIIEGVEVDLSVFDNEPGPRPASQAYYKLGRYVYYNNWQLSWYWNVDKFRWEKLD